jgi:hypothetical protein
VRYFVLCSHTSLTLPASAGGVTSNVRLHTASSSAARSKNTNTLLRGAAQAPERGQPGWRASRSNPHEPQQVEAVWAGEVNSSLGKWRTLKPLVVQASEPSPLQRRWISVHSACALCKNYSSAAADLRGTARPLLLCARLGAGAVRPKSFVIFASSSCKALYEAKPRVNPIWSLTPRSTPTRSGRQRKAGVRHSVLCSHTSLTPPAYAGGVTSNVRHHYLRHRRDVR